MTKIYTPKVGPKGQMTLPKGIRDVLGIREGDRLLLKIGPEGKIVLEKALIISASTKDTARIAVKG